MSRKSGRRFSDQDMRNSKRIGDGWRKQPRRRAAAKKKSPARKGRAQSPGKVQPFKSEARHHAVETEQVGERLELTPLIVVEAHDQRKARRLEAVDVDFAHVDLGHA